MSSLAIRVSSAAGEPLAEIPVDVWQDGSQSDREVVTRSDGRATVSSLSDSEAWVSCRDTEHFAAPPTLSVFPKGQEISLVMRPTGPIEGMVLDPDGAPLAGVEVARDAVNVESRIALSDAQGRFRISSPLGEPADLRLTGGGVQEREAGTRWLTLGTPSSGALLYRGELHRVIAPAHDVVLQARGPRTLSVIVLDGDGLPASSVIVEGRPRPPRTDCVMTDVEGRVTLARLPDEEVALTAYPSERSSTPWVAAKMLRVTPAGQSVELRLRRSAVLTGIVLDADGAPVWGDCVRASAPDELGYGTVSDATGRFRLIVATGATYDVSVDHVAERNLSVTVKSVSADGPELVVRLARQ